MADDVEFMLANRNANCMPLSPNRLSPNWFFAQPSADCTPGPRLPHMLCRLPHADYARCVMIVRFVRDENVDHGRGDWTGDCLGCDMSS